jgi:hypothetical protein
LLANADPWESKMYAIAFDEKTRVLHVSCEGFWDTETAKSFCAELETTIERLRKRFGSVATFSDSRKMQVQTPQVVAILGEMTQKQLSVPTSRVAMMPPAGVLNSMQAKRIAGHSNFRMFADEAEAWEWLREDPGTRL